jgi:hypothetical protein
MLNSVPQCGPAGQHKSSFPRPSAALAAVNEPRVIQEAIVALQVLQS